MAQASGNTVTTTGTGESDHIVLSPGEHVLIITASSWGDADLQVGVGSTFVDARDSAGVVNLTANRAVIVPGGVAYRLDVTTHSSAITMTAHQSTFG